MAGASSYADEGDGPTISEINVTPLVDVVLVLLIVFMITMPAIIAEDSRRERELDVQLPRASGAKPFVMKPQKLVINTRASGVYVVQGEVVSPEVLARRLEQANADNPGGVTVLIRADRNALWDHVVAVMEMCRQANIRDCRAAAVE